MFPAPPEGKHTRRGGVTPSGVPVRHIATGAWRSLHRPWRLRQHLGACPCLPPKPWSPSPATTCHPAPHHTSTGLLNCPWALERNFSFPLDMLLCFLKELQSHHHNFLTRTVLRHNVSLDLVHPELTFSTQAVID